MNLKVIKDKKCRQCKEYFQPSSSTQIVCNWSCARDYAREKEQKKFNAETRKMKEKIKTLTEHLNDAQGEFNKFIRLRDEGNLCISCQNPPKKKNAGHYRTTAAASQLRFNEDNCNLQCEHCNTHKSGNVTEYRINLVKKIGQWKVEELERNNQLADWTIEKAIEIKKQYREKCKQFN